mmetsp:Transcript_40002/g.127259  ORF Transcript_40002/g.127259 Transcript_40002/m.127259 type:complete len:225 (+) Transcript_40002:830-1504(+)
MARVHDDELLDWVILFAELCVQEGVEFAAVGTGCRADHRHEGLAAFAAQAGGSGSALQRLRPVVVARPKRAETLEEEGPLQVVPACLRLDQHATRRHLPEHHGEVHVPLRRATAPSAALLRLVVHGSRGLWRARRHAKLDLDKLRRVRFREHVGQGLRGRHADVVRALPRGHRPAWQTLRRAAPLKAVAELALAAWDAILVEVGDAASHACALVVEIVKVESHG